MLGILRSHPRSFFFFLGLLVLAGIAATFYTPVALLPPVSFPKVRVSLQMASRPINRTNIELTTPVESIVRQVPGVRSVRSRTSRGQADITIDFDWGTNMERAALQISAAIERIKSSLPSELQVSVVRMDPSSFPILGYNLISDKLSATTLHDIAQYQLMPLLLDVQGVADVQVLGGEVEEYHVLVDPVRLSAMGLSMADVSNVLASANLFSEVGRLEENYQFNLITAGAQLEELEQITQLVVRNSAKQLVVLQDIATIKRSSVPQWISVTADGRDAVIVQVLQQPNSNSLQIGSDIAAKVEAFRKRMPQGLVISPWYDQSQLVKQSAGTVVEALVIGVLLASAVLFIALQSVSIAAVVLIVIPAVLLITAVAMYLLGMSFNIMSLGGMAAGVGLMLDDVIVVAEYIVRRVRDSKQVQEQMIWQAASDFLPSLAGSSAATIIILMPLAFLENVTGAFFQTLSLTMACGLVISFFASWLAVPMLLRVLISSQDAKKDHEIAFFSNLHTRYTHWMTTLFARPLLILAGVLPFIILGLYAYTQVGSGFLPEIDEGGFILDYHAKPGTSLTETNRLLQQVEAIIRTIPEVDTYTRRTGVQLGGSITDTNEGDFFIRLKNDPRRDVGAIMDELRSSVERQVPGLNIELAQLMEDAIGDLTEVPQPIEIKVFDDNAATLEGVAKTVAEAIGQVEGVVDVHNSMIVSGDTLEIVVDPVKAALEGMDVNSVTAMLNDYLTGQVPTKIFKQAKTIGVRLWVSENQRDTKSALQNLMLRAPDGHLFPLEHIAILQPLEGEPEIYKDNLKRMVVVTARISGRDLGSTVKDIQGVLDQPDFLPKGAYYVLGGLYKQQQVAFDSLVRVFLAATALVFLLLLLLFEDFYIAFAVILMPLLSLSAVFIGLWITGVELNISSMMGMTMILGIMTEVAIFFFTEYQQLPGNGSARLVDAGNKRMRPIIMTTLTTILALLPLVISLGHGASIHRPLAIAIISGMVVQLPLVLIVMPTLFWGLQRKGKEQTDVDTTLSLQG